MLSTNESTSPTEVVITPPVPGPGVAAVAEARLRNHASTALRRLTCDYRGGVLTLRGSLSSPYLRQAAQDAVSSLDGVQRVDNLIELIRRTWC